MCNSPSYARVDNMMCGLTLALLRVHGKNLTQKFLSFLSFLWFIVDFDNSARLCSSVVRASPSCFLSSVARVARQHMGKKKKERLQRVIKRVHSISVPIAQNQASATLAWVPPARMKSQAAQARFWRTGGQSQRREHCGGQTLRSTEFIAEVCNGRAIQTAGNDVYRT